MGGVPAMAEAQAPDRAERHRVPADFMSYQGAPWLERDERVQEEQPGAVLDAMGLEPGDVVFCNLGMMHATAPNRLDVPRLMRVKFLFIEK